MEIVQIQTKTFIYKIPVTAMILSEEEFEKLNSDRINRFGTKIPVNAEKYKREVKNLKIDFFNFLVP